MDMRSLSRITYVLSIFLALTLFPSLPAQENPLAPEEFLSQYASTLQDQSQDPRQRLIKNNPALAHATVSVLLEQSIQLELSGKPDKAKESLLQANQIASVYQAAFNDPTLSKQVALYQGWSLEDKQKKASADILSIEA
ncbi:MAG: hypothetical protein L0Y56_22020, partial [Nitrospira sp.]|nr:hypothetical protein [Nitrospira sp.]